MNATNDIEFKPSLWSPEQRYFSPILEEVAKRFVDPSGKRTRVYANADGSLTVQVGRWFGYSFDLTLLKRVDNVREYASDALDRVARNSPRPLSIDH